MRFKIFNICLASSQEKQSVFPCVVISPDVMNDSLKTVIVAPLTHHIAKIPFRPLTNYSGHPLSIALDQSRAVPKTKLLKEIGQLNQNEIEATRIALLQMFQ